MQNLISGLIIAVGLVLLVGKVYVDSEPGAIPLLLIALGIGGYSIGWIRTRRSRA